MIKDNQKVFNRLLVIIDALITAASFVLAYYIKFYILNDGPGIGVLPVQDYYMLLPFIVPGYMFLYYRCSVYSPKRTVRRRHEIYSILQANTIGLAALIIILYMIIREINFSRSVMAIFYVLNVFLTSVFRIIMRKALRSIRKKGYNLKHILLVGYSRAAEEYIDRILSNPQWGYVVCGILDEHIPGGTTYKGVKVLGTLGNLEYILPENKLDEIAITLSLKDYDYLEGVVDICEKSGVHTKFIPDYSSLIPSRPYTEDLMGLPVINIRYVPLTNTGNMVIKRAMDIVGSIFGIIITSPIMLISAILVKLSSPGPVIFKQERVGLHNKPFYMYKFRSMYMDAEERKKELMKQNRVSDGLMFKMENDPRIIGSKIDQKTGEYIPGIGNWIRKLSLDEFPQFFNVLRGDMSLVGTRPPTVDEYEKYKLHHKARLSVKPGITGLWQVSGRSEITDFEEVVKLDTEYICHWSMANDIKILLRTVQVVISGKGSM